MKTNIKDIKNILKEYNSLDTVDKLLKNTSIDDRDLSCSIKSIDEEKRTFTAIATDSDIVDSDGEVVLSSGCDYSTRYIKNPIILYEHDLRRPIGKCISLTKSDKVIEITVEIGYGDEADKIWSLIQQDILKGVSIRYIPIDWRYPNAQDKQNYQGVKRIITKYILCEISVTSLPANDNTLITDRSNAKSIKDIVQSVTKIERVIPTIDITDVITKSIKDEVLKSLGRIYRE